MIRSPPRYDNMASIIYPMLDLNKRLSQTRTSDEKTMLQRQIDATDKLIYPLLQVVWFERRGD